MNEELLLSKIRQVTEEDRETLPVFSYSKMDTHKTCAYRYDKQYHDKLRSEDTTIALELGTLCHYILEQKGKMLLVGKEAVDYIKLNEIKLIGTEIADDKTKEPILGIQGLKKKYFDEWYEPDNASGMTYEEKMKIFDNIVQTEMEEDDEWKPYLFEHQFEFVWDDRIIIMGFIDRIDRHVQTGDFRTVDYKTSKKVYDTKKLATSLQFGIYALAILNEFGQLPVQSMYRFILIDDKQNALTLGWEKRLIKAIDKLLDQIDANDKSGIWKPSPSPLCHWCNYSATNPNAYQYKDVCPYYSLWTPDNKTFSVNEVFNPETQTTKLNASSNVKRKLIF